MILIADSPEGQSDFHNLRVELAEITPVDTLTFIYSPCEKTYP